MTNNLLKIKYINLDRRIDRKNTIEAELNKHNLIYERFSAIDGQKLIMTSKIKQMFHNNTFSWRRSIVGCSLSHIGVWKELIKSDYQYYMILEDDITLHKHFYRYIGSLLYTLSKTTAPEIVFMGYTSNLPYVNPHNPPFIGLEDYNNIFLYKIYNKQYIWGGLFGYIISKSHAIKLLDIIDKKGINDPIDKFVINNTSAIYMTNPDLVKTEFAIDNESHNNGIYDSDILYDFLAIDDEYDFYEQMDSYGDDLKFVSATTVEQIKKIASYDDNCVAFNTLGFLKKKICTPDKFIKISDSKLSGIYIKRNHPLNTEYREYVQKNKN